MTHNDIFLTLNLEYGNKDNEDLLYFGAYWY